ncbi:hypothetical protein CVS40_9894 [Lucilia cuprina]|nr:hypothetical protein CVS40_9892 [Lucilia cuprina]KAI8118475.1 hypothetical protein CVS40_9894 [Lucilia cuprina]
MSKRNYKRLLKKQSILYKNRSSENEILISPSVNCENFVEPECSVSSQIDFPKYSLREKIKNWYIETGPSRKCLEKLLIILQEEGLDVPLSAAALMGKRQELSIRKVFGGNYCHIGIESQLRKFEQVLKNYDEIELDINIDGIPLFKSSRVQLWPILLKIVNVQEKVKPFPIGIYVGLSKPKCVKDFCKDFVEDVLSLNGECFLNDKKIKISFRCLSCDTPAKAFICGVPGHTASHGCTKCTQISKKIGNVLTVHLAKL